MMTKIRPAYVYLAVGVALIMGWFYWYEYRPEQIRQESEQIRQECAVFVSERAAAAAAAMPVRELSIVQNMCEDAGGKSNFMDAIGKGMAQNAD